jgi:hypothetical protein
MEGFYYAYLAAALLCITGAVVSALPAGDDRHKPRFA